MTIEDRRQGMAAGPFIADALAMPVHWYYDREALRRDKALREANGIADEPDDS